jgi:hypothetical protein
VSQLNASSIRDLYLEAKEEAYTQLARVIAQIYGIDVLTTMGMSAAFLDDAQFTALDPRAKQALVDLFTSGKPQRM